MTTFEGKSASYVAGKMPVNREPLYTAVGKKLLESLYSVHRERIMKVQKTVDDRLQVYDFLTDTSWKQVYFYHLNSNECKAIFINFKILSTLKTKDIEKTRGAQINET